MNEDAPMPPPLEPRLRELAEECRGSTSEGAVIREREPLARRTTLRVGGPADLFVEPACERDLGTVTELCRQAGTPWMVLGRGSNVLVLDGGVRGVVIHLSHPSFSRIEADGATLRCGAGAKLKDVAAEARRRGISGMEFLEGIPGCVGGGLRMNAGAMGSAVFDVLHRARALGPDGRWEDLQASEIPAKYRSCPFFEERIAVAAVFEGVPDSPAEIGARMKTFSEKRWASQPAALSAGCMFKNTPQAPAGRLIDEMGLKGARIGGAMVSEVHGNFIVNTGGGTARDVLDLIEWVRERARALRGIELEPEVRVVGEPLSDSVAGRR